MPVPTNSSISINRTTVPGGAALATFQYTDEDGDTVQAEAVVIVDSEGNEINLDQPSGTGANVPISASLTPVTLLDADPDRLGLSVYNASSGNLYLLLAPGTPGPSSFTVILVPGAYYEDPFQYTGAVTGVWGSVMPGDQAMVNTYKA